MSWSVQVIGNPENVAKHLDEVSEKLSGQSKVEFDDAKPYLQGLVRQTFVSPEGQAKGHQIAAIEFEANGSGVSSNDTQLARTCTVKITPTYRKVV